MKVPTTLISALIAYSGLAGKAEIDFVQEIRPILVAHCTKCHGGVRAKADLSFVRKASAFKPAKSGLLPIIAGKPDKSELILRINHAEEDERMPPNNPLTNEQIETLRQWIKEGAKWPTHWSFAPRNNPTSDNESIDSLIKKTLKGSGLNRAPEAPRHTLIRRLSLDLLGLPPDPKEVFMFEKDSSPEAYENLVKKMLDSPQFGERWARHWLDGARYADSDGYEKDNDRPNAWRWRKWVIDAINSDMPFDKFTVEQLAGDLLPEATAEQRLATAFHRQTLFNREGGVDAEEDRTKRTIDRTNTTASIWLGLTIECAQCHDHPYDPISQRDFYQLYAFFNNSEESETQVPKNPSGSMMKVRVISEKKRETYIFHRGDFLQPQKEKGTVSPLTPAIFSPMNVRDAKKPNRLDLARWIIDKKNPLAARVAVNDIWSRLFGKGLVETKADFGARAIPPVHLQLLDHLANKFISMDWSRKRLINYIAKSITYRQSSARRAGTDSIDPENELFHRQNRARVEGEIMRDLFLSTSGLLKHKVGGPSVFPPIPSDVAEQSFAGSFKWNTSNGEDRYRRGMYTFFKRTAADPNLLSFDCPDANVSVVQRNISNTPIMALATMCNEVFHESAQALAKRILSDTSLNDDRSRIERAFALCIARHPLAEESDKIINLLRKSRSYYSDNPEEATKIIGKHGHQMTDLKENAAWVTATRILLNLDETINRE